MGKTFSQLGSWREDENKSILSSKPAIGSKAVSYSSTGSSKSFCSCVPCEGTADASFVTCPTCQGSGKIPQGEWPKALEIAWNPGKVLSLLAWGSPSESPWMGLDLLPALDLPVSGWPGRYLTILGFPAKTCPPSLVVFSSPLWERRVLATVLLSNTVCPRIHSVQEVTNELSKDAGHL